MAIIKIYNNDSHRMETYYRGENEAMPYITNRTLTVREFRGSSRANMLWTDKRTMQTWNQFRAYYGAPIHVGFAFKRIWEGGHSGQSQHYAGTAFDVGQNLGATARNALRNSAIYFGKWSYVEPTYLTPTWVHFDKRQAPPACTAGGYPLVRDGSRGIYVLVLQDALNALGYVSGTPDGMFGQRTLTQVRAFQRANGLSADGIVGCNTWRTLTGKAVGTGKTSTVID
ncbi:peptidoglycan-binding protein [Clostridia bacterium OttesenSCG-928-F22]|nr:peptidoglycan-binding protein [Clostridia bacterium OttesenSCG-928-F22]